MRSTVGMKFDCILEEPLDFIDIDYTHLNKTIRYEQRPQGDWIPCSERLPEEHYQYLVTIKNSSGSTFTTTSYFFTAETGWSHDGVIAWMPFPKAYKKEGEENG